MLIGDSAGETAVCNVINGAKIKNLPKHTSEVTKIVHIMSMNLFVTASTDNTIKFSDDKKINESDLVRTIPLGDVLVGSLIHNPYLNLIMAGINKKIIGQKKK
jgi:WD40 repeat protein